MTTAALVLVVICLFATIMVTTHALEQRAWRRRLHAFRLYLQGL